MPPCLPLWHRFKPSHIIRESRASLLCLWGFPSRLYNDLPVGLFWCWRRSLPANPAQLWPGSSPNRTHFVLKLCFWHQLFVHDSSSWLLCFTYSRLFLLTSPSFLFSPSPSTVWSVFQAWLFFLFLFFSVSLFFVSFLLTSFPALASSTFFPSLSAEEAVSAVMYEGSWRPPASQQSVWRVFLSSTIGYWLSTRLYRWINTNCNTCRSRW